MNDGQVLNGDIIKYASIIYWLKIISLQLLALVTLLIRHILQLFQQKDKFLNLPIIALTPAFVNSGLS